MQQEAPDSLFKFSSKEKGQYTSQILRDNLALLLQQAQQIETITSSLTGKSIKHRFEVDGGKQKFFKGRVISQVPGFPDWFNVVYVEEPGIVYSYKLSEDIEKGDLKIL